MMNWKVAACVQRAVGSANKLSVLECVENDGFN